jgi:isopentenyl diphosphate isomerase/L-lactate dehydrogenase-like FMN-dependent dehydrogenase
MPRWALNIEDLRHMRGAACRMVFLNLSIAAAKTISYLNNNRAALQRIKLRPRVLNDVSARNPAITLFGKARQVRRAMAALRIGIGDNDRTYPAQVCRSSHRALV